jgi:putative phosphotransacetylase
MKIPVAVLPRHVHLSQADLSALFGAGAKLTPSRELSHRGQVVYRETVTLVGKNGTMEKVRILGPHREGTQVEISVSEAAALGINAPVRLSGDAKRAGSGELIGPKGKVKVSSVIIPSRHLHCDEVGARELGVKHHDLITLVSLKDATCRLEQVMVRVHPTFANELHLNPDEAAEYWLADGDLVTQA